MIDLTKVYARIDNDIDRHIKQIQGFIRQPTISNTGEGMKEGAEYLREVYEKLGCEIAEIRETPGWPVVYGEYDADAEKTLIIYMMYDCMPADEPGWSVSPFEAELVHNHQVGSYQPFKTVLMARGAINSKGPLIAFLNTVESIKAEEGKLPVNLILIAEGEEEQASRHLPWFLNKHKERLKQADAMFFPMGGQTVDGSVTICPGTKGIAYFELECSGELWGRGPKKFDVHGSNKVVIDSPAWRLVHALESMTSSDGNRCLIDGWYSNVAPPTEEENKILDQLAISYDYTPIKQGLYVDNFAYPEEDTREFLRRYYCEPSGLNIDGISSGYTGPGSKTVLPHKATVKLDVRFVPDQKSDEFKLLLRAHLDRHGYKDIQITQLTSGEWARTSINSPLWKALRQTYESFGHTPKTVVRNIGYGPFSLFCHEPLNLHGGFAWGMLGHGTRAHSPDEYFVIEGNDKVHGLAGCEKSFASILSHYAEI
jgi:acetylornithine deacetylase/succinyl-diaminopimelate desuccinylase-like protein